MTPLPSPITRKALLALPQRKWDLVSEYNSLLIVPTNRKHDSGYGLIAIVGRQGDEAEIAAVCDDICWTMPQQHPYGSALRPGRNSNILRTDCLWPSRVLHMWASGEHYFRGRFRVYHNVSSTEVELFLEPTGVNKVTGETVERLEPCR